MMAARMLVVERLGRVEYGQALAKQEALVEARIAGDIPDTLLLLEHNPVITLGRGAKPDHVLLSPSELAQANVATFETGRGGDVTFHGPGQLVAYPILDLNPDQKDVRRYVWTLEEIMIRVAESYGLHASRIAGFNGAWIDERKIGAVGVRIRQWVTMHGFALNVNTDLSQFSMIVPCGIADKAVTSLSEELSQAVELSEVEDRVIDIASEVWGRMVA